MKLFVCFFVLEKIRYDHQVQLANEHIGPRRQQPECRRHQPSTPEIDQVEHRRLRLGLARDCACELIIYKLWQQYCRCFLILFSSMVSSSTQSYKYGRILLIYLQLSSLRKKLKKNAKNMFE